MTTCALRKWSPSALSSVMPTAKGTPRRCAWAATNWNSSLSANSTTSITFSGHTTKSTLPGSISPVAPRCRAKTWAADVLIARVPCGPPPCTIATRVSPVAVPSASARGASTSQISSAAVRPATPCHWPLLVTPRLRANAGTTGDGPDNANPIWNTNHVSRIEPPTALTVANGPAACPIGKLARGTPPKGKQNLKASARVCAAGRPMTRQGPRGAIHAAVAWTPANMAAASK